MSTEQLAVLAVMISGAVAVWSAYLSARSSKDNTQRTLQTQTDTTKLTLEHERDLAQEARLWDKMADAYVQVLQVVALFMVIVDETYPKIGDGERGNPPPPPDSNTTMGLMARVAAFGSQSAYAALEAWWSKRLEFDHAVWELDTVRARLTGVDARDIFNLTQAQHRTKLDDARAASHDAVRALQDQINHELH